MLYFCFCYNRCLKPANLTHTRNSPYKGLVEALTLLRVKREEELVQTLAANERDYVCFISAVKTSEELDGSSGVGASGGTMAKPPFGRQTELQIHVYIPVMISFGWIILVLLANGVFLQLRMLLFTPGSRPSLPP